MITGKKIHIRITLKEEMLGMSPSDPKIHEEFIASKAPDAPSLEEEVAVHGVEEVVENGKTIFPKLEDGTPFLWDYQIRGFFKESIGFLKRVSGSKCSKVTAHKKRIDGTVFIDERKIPILVPQNENGETEALGDCQRPLRAQTAQGDRVALANSETVPGGSKFEFTINLLDESLEPALRECLDYAELHGFGQWRNSAKGIAYWEELDENGKVIDGDLPADLKATA